MYNKIKFLWKFIKDKKFLYVASLLSIGLATSFSLLSPLVIRATIDSVIGNIPLELPGPIAQYVDAWSLESVLVKNLWICSGLLVIITIINGLFSYTKGKWSAIASEYTAMKIRNELYRKFQSLPYDYHVKAETGDLIQRSTSDVETIRFFLSVQMTEAGRGIFMVLIVVSLMLTLDKGFTLIAMSLIPVIFIFSAVYFIRIQKAFKYCDESDGKMSASLQENLTGIRVVKAFGREAHEYKRFDERNSEFRNLSYRLNGLFAWYWSISDFLSLIQLVLVVVFGVYFVAEGRISLGTMIAFSSYEGMLLWPIRQLGKILTDMGKMMVSIDRIKQVISEKDEDMNEQGETPDLNGDIVFNNVSFGYENGNKVLKNISFTAVKGKTIAILGATGSGKTSLVHLMQRLYDYQEGSITINGVELKNINKKWLRSEIGIILQEPFLFSRSIKENITMATVNAKEEEIFEAADAAAIHRVIKEFDKGYNTIVGERGVTLSGGQKQRVAIARSLIKKSDVLIFDDSLSAVDTHTDIAIRKALKKRSSGITTFIISHRISTLAEADLILVLEKGCIVQKGTHDELIKEPGLYRKIWSVQMEGSDII